MEFPEFRAALALRLLLLPLTPASAFSCGAQGSCRDRVLDRYECRALSCGGVGNQRAAVDTVREALNALVVRQAVLNSVVNAPVQSLSVSSPGALHRFRPADLLTDGDHNRCISTFGGKVKDARRRQSL